MRKLRPVLPLLATVVFLLGAAAQNPCESRLTTASLTADQLFAALDGKLAELAGLAKRLPLDPKPYVKSFVEIETLAKSWVDAQKEVSPAFDQWMKHFAAELAKANEQFAQNLPRGALSRTQAKQMLKAAANFPSPIVRLSVNRLAVSHAAFANLELSFEAKVSLLKDSIVIAALDSHNFRYHDAYWGDLYFDLLNWKELAMPSAEESLHRIGTVLSTCFTDTPPGELTARELRFIADLADLLPTNIPLNENLRKQMYSGVDALAPHREQLNRYRSGLFDRIRQFSP